MQRRTLLLGGAVVAGGAAVGGYFFGQKLWQYARGLTRPGTTGTALDKISHVVVLMLENRSFDNLLGKLYPKSDRFDGLSGSETNPDLEGRPVPIKNIPGTGQLSIINPWPDPGELFTDINEQLFRTRTPAPGQTPTMDGFVINFLHQPDASEDHYGELAQRIMHYYEPEQVPVISRLARQFAVCDQWFASAPCQTWPNRFFMHTGTAGGFENNEPYHFLEVPTIFDRLTEKLGPNSWVIYRHDFSLALNLPRLWFFPLNFFLFSDFLDDAKKGNLPAYSFIEPRYLPDTELPNDQHPPHGVTAGEQLIATVYNALRNGPQWTSTLLIITYDEHGGCYDHVPPPAAVPPDAIPTSPFAFDRYGVRVPAVIVSPYIKANTILRAPKGGAPFDHTSILATLRKRFALSAPLTRRDAAAPDLGMVDMWLNTPDNLGPERIEALPEEDFAARLEASRRDPVNDLQKSLLHINAQLPTPDRTVKEHIEARKSRGPVPAPDATMSAGEAAEVLKPLPEKLKTFRQN
jgi:phospholipase C